MILKRFPGQFNNKADFSIFHRQNVVVWAKSCDVSYTEHTAPLSIKFCLKGKEIYELNSLAIAVEDDKYLVINNEQTYASYILSNETVESFCLFFQDELEKEVLAAFVNSHENLLDNPHSNSRGSAPFFQNLRRSNSLISPLLRRIYEEIKAGFASQLWLDEQSGNLIEVLLQEHFQILQEIEKMPMIRYSTRVEIYKRLCLAKDYIESCYDESVNLKKLARIACLSQHHFLRLFKTAFHQTPHQYLTKIRLQKAAQLIKNQNFSITDICQSVGYENPSSFTRLFKRSFKITPIEFRQINQR